MLKFRQTFSGKLHVLIGMIHLKALPGTPCYNGSIDKIVSSACSEAQIYKKYDIDAVLVENMHDIPYLQPNNFTPETTAMMTYVCSKVREILPPHIKCGVQVLAGGNKEALAISQAAGLDFIRVEGFIFSHMADEGFTDACAGNLLRYRTLIGANNVLIFSDIKKKHSSHAITSDISLEETAKAAKFFLSDGVIITGTVTGDPVDPKDLQSVKKAVDIPVLIGSGVTADNLYKYQEADAIIVGSHFKEDGKWENNICEGRMSSFLKKFKELYHIN